MTKTKRLNQVVARMTMTRSNNIKIIVEIHEGAGFMNFYTWYRQEGRKRKVHLRCSSRNDGIAPHWRAPSATKGLDVLATRTTQIMKDVTGVTIKVLKKRKYAAMLSCSPDQLAGGLPQNPGRVALHEERPRWERSTPSAVHLPIGYIPLQKRMDIITGTKR